MKKWGLNTTGQTWGQSIIPGDEYEDSEMPEDEDNDEEAI